MKLIKGSSGAGGGSNGFTSYESKQFTIAGAQTDYNVASVQTMFSIVRKNVSVKAGTIALTFKLNSITNNSISLAAGEQITFDNFAISNIFVTTTADSVVRIISFS